LTLAGTGANGTRTSAGGSPGIICASAIGCATLLSKLAAISSLLVRIQST
jgi:hypothetical protein